MAITTLAKRHRTDHLVRKARDPEAFLRKGREACSRWHARHPVYRREYYCRSRFGLGADVVQRFVAEYVENNGPLCAVCKRVCDVVGGVKMAGRRRLVVDHDHKTGRLRGMLCDFCNTALGKLDEDTDVMKALILYVEKRR